MTTLKVYKSSNFLREKPDFEYSFGNSEDCKLWLDFKKKRKDWGLSTGWYVYNILEDNVKASAREFQEHQGVIMCKIPDQFSYEII